MIEAATHPSSSLELIHHQPKTAKGEVLAPRGSIVVFLAANGSKALLALRAAARGRGLSDGLLDGTDRADEDCLRATLRHGETVLAENVPVPHDGRAVRLILPYNGGTLEPSGVTLVGEGIEAIGVVHAPPLTVGERAALSLLPESMLQLNLGVALAGGIAADNDEERRRQQEEQRRAADEARAERAQQMAEAQADRAEARADQRAEQRGGSRLEVHLLETTLGMVSPTLSASAMLAIRRELVLHQVETRG